MAVPVLTAAIMIGGPLFPESRLKAITQGYLRRPRANDITVTHDRKQYRYTIEHQVIDQRTEHFKLIARNKTLTIESNRPLFRNKGLKYRRYDLKVLEGNTEAWNMAFMQKVFEQIEKLVEIYLDK